MVSRATFAKIERIRSLLATAEGMRGHAKGRVLRRRAAALLAGLPAVLRETARQWIEWRGPRYCKSGPKRVRRV